MSGFSTGRCGFSGCENPCPRDEAFCCSGCEEADIDDVCCDANVAASALVGLSAARRAEDADVGVGGLLGLADDPAMLYETTDRGFKHFEPIPTTYGHVVIVYEYSAAAQPCLWLDITQTQESRMPARTNIAPESATAHLTLAQAATVRDALSAAIANHYQHPSPERLLTGPEAILARKVVRYRTALEGLSESAGWYHRCLEDVADGRSVRCLGEARAGYDEAQMIAREALIPDAERERPAAATPAELRYRAALEAVATHALVERNPDGDDQAAWTMQMIAREALGMDDDCGARTFTAPSEPGEA